MSRGTRSSPAELARSVGSEAREFAGKIRRMVVTRTSSPLWQVVGHKLLDGSTETRDAENFAGLAGFYSRPSDDDDVEAIIAFPGGAGNPVIVATRQEAVRRVIAADLAADETQMHNSAVLIRIRANGTVEIRTSGGTALPLATKADIDALAAWIDTTMVVVTPSGNSTPGSTTPPPAATGTIVLKAE